MSRNAPSDSVYAVTTHCSSARSVPKSCWMAGSATVTTMPSSATSRSAAHSSSSALRPVLGSVVAVARVLLGPGKGDLLLRRARGPLVLGPRAVVDLLLAVVALGGQGAAGEVQDDPADRREYDEDQQEEKCDSAFHASGLPAAAWRKPARGRAAAKRIEGGFRSWRRTTAPASRTTSSTRACARRA